jgi:hypothetical protein
MSPAPGSTTAPRTSAPRPGLHGPVRRSSSSAGSTTRGRPGADGSLYGEYSTDGGATWLRPAARSPAPRRAVDDQALVLLACRRQAVAVPVPLPDRRWRERGRRVPRRHRDGPGRHGLHRRRRVRQQRLDGDQGWTISTGTETATDAALLPGREPRQYVGYDARCRPGRTSSARPSPGPTGWSTSRSRTACWSGTSTGRSPTTTPAPTRARARDGRRRPPAPLTYPDGTAPSNRRQPFDATFGLQAVDPVCLHKQVADTSPAGYSTVRGVRDGSRREADVRRHQPERVLGRDEPAELREGGRSRCHCDRHR